MPPNVDIEPGAFDAAKDSFFAAFAGESQAELVRGVLVAIESSREAGITLSELCVSHLFAVLLMKGDLRVLELILVRSIETPGTVPSHESFNDPRLSLSTSWTTQDVCATPFDLCLWLLTRTSLHRDGTHRGTRYPASSPRTVAAQRRGRQRQRFSQVAAAVRVGRLEWRAEPRRVGGELKFRSRLVVQEERVDFRKHTVLRSRWFVTDDDCLGRPSWGTKLRQWRGQARAGKLPCQSCRRTKCESFSRLSRSTVSSGETPSTHARPMRRARSTGRRIAGVSRDASGMLVRINFTLASFVCCRVLERSRASYFSHKLAETAPCL